MSPAIEGLTDEERFPLLTAAGRKLLDDLRQHPRAPRYNFRTGDRLDAAAINRLLSFEQRLSGSRPSWAHADPPDWVRELAARCLRDVPIYRRGGGSPDDFAALPTVSKRELAREPWAFVPDDAPLDGLMVYYTSGTTGKPVHVLSHPETATRKLILYRKALALRGVTLEGGPGRVMLAFVCSQQSTLTYATLSTYLGEAGVVKVNLRPEEWSDPGDRAKFLDDCNPEILTGNPLSFLELAELPVRIKPKALISSAMKVLPATRTLLEQRFGCPVVDIYSLCETGPVAVADGDRYPVLPDDLYVEILDEAGRACRPGEIGEITLTGGRNPFLPLLRFRTGDFAALSFDRDVPCLTSFEGRAPVVFAGTDGRRINNIDVATVLRPFPLALFSLHQAADRSLSLRLRGAESSIDAIRDAIIGLFGAGQRLTIEALPEGTFKVVPYSTDIA